MCVSEWELSVLERVNVNVMEFVCVGVGVGGSSVPSRSKMDS